MIVIGVDPHKQSHTAAVVEEGTGELSGEWTVRARRQGHEQLFAWARSLGSERLWALEDCRHVSIALERLLLASGERVVRVPPELMAGARRGARQRGKSDAIDALAVARAALREPELPIAALESGSRELRLLVDHREDLVGERTRAQNRLRWQLHELEPELGLPAGALDRRLWLDRIARRLARREQTAQVRICRELVVGETGGADRFADEARLAMHAGAAPLPASSGKRQRHRLNRSGNRQLNCALHRIAVTQGQHHPSARAYLARKQPEGKSRKEAPRCPKRHLARTIYRTLTTITADKTTPTKRPALTPALT